VEFALCKKNVTGKRFTLCKQLLLRHAETKKANVYLICTCIHQ